MDKTTIMQMLKELKSCQARAEYLEASIISAVESEPNLSKAEVIEIMEEMGYTFLGEDNDGNDVPDKA